MAYEAQREFFSKYPFTRELDRTELTQAERLELIRHLAAA